MNSKSIKNTDVKGVLFDIKKYAIHDGPGIRTTVFFKGCPLRCSWCHNPESWESQPELMVRQARCVRCGRCMEICPEHANELKDGRIERDPSRCRLCGACIEACPADGREMVGREWTAGEVLREIEKDSVFYDQSGGGVTFSGGEPLMQPEFLTALLILCRNQGFHTAVDTSCSAKPEIASQIADLSDLVLCDLKHIDPEKHREFTGSDNFLILNNLRLIAEKSCEMIIRIPVVPGFNDRPEEVESIGNFVKSLKIVNEIDLLPYNSGGAAKAERLGRQHEVLTTARPDDRQMNTLKTILEGLGFLVKIGG